MVFSIYVIFANVIEYRGFRVENSIIFEWSRGAFRLLPGPLELETIAEGLVRSWPRFLWRCRSGQGKSKFDKAGNLLFKMRLWSSPAVVLTYFRPFSSPSRTPVHLVFLRGRPSWSSTKEGFSRCLLFSFIKYTDPRRNSILLGELLFVVPSPASVTGSGSEISFFLSFSLFSFFFFFSSLSCLTTVKSFSVHHVNEYVSLCVTAIFSYILI